MRTIKKTLTCLQCKTPYSRVIDNLDEEDDFRAGIRSGVCDGCWERKAAEMHEGKAQ